MEGIINLYKESGMTSHDCVFKLRKILQTKKIGHGGTLDPDVEGVLPICVGRATKVIEYMVDSGKTYEGEITLGYSTTTEDASGDMVEKQQLVHPFSEAEIKSAMQTFLGEQLQIPPMYSAVKVNGRRLYEYARKNEVVERPIRKINVTSFQLIDEPRFEDGLQRFNFRVCCSKGTYVRTLAVDLGEKLGIPSHMSFLRRTEAAGLTVNEALKLSELEVRYQKRDLSFLKPIELGIQNLVSVSVSEAQFNQLKNGGKFLMSDFGFEKRPIVPIAVFFQDKLVAIYIAHPEKKDILKPSKVLV
ncbi:MULTISPECIES: tRNA pseudouridine(55) synthase TruB [unclassified Enterococcus]|uniref:tRNA pseudouridine(55) synthase TruB n=1 Tax=unclassified Enterococcus TaxID=2608891 RepID=UPI00155343A6|nr:MULTISPECIES: tRNA pseudouridine(55) synthase TruB [unclassified Enterococcus]MBS7578030.1 tRNA pseudouridine(55) synthase TruB [Enterococcus sp. MMGLQ5-2]MBS7585280.1 tRNA pseudouridine(55) synthase TruB [Enterococcus sp. MMGLQ5-1]NPD13137.1 tRNA pseudouridine(55) synthase TruB [Enterococcus sp. MMGLQ5-1]NPD37861.1 tRNA pseudouridine(55) synthase TruB [Enterococcus sp. MMGLQ5-2]